MTNHNTTAANMDLDSMITYLEDMLSETMQFIAEGVHL